MTEWWFVGLLCGFMLAGGVAWIVIAFLMNYGYLVRKHVHQIFYDEHGTQTTHCVKCSQRVDLIARARRDG